jgi:non-canonical (house-cleaning) NTP pyrophosphatase
MESCIIVGSTNRLKVAVVKKVCAALGIEAEIIPVKTPQGYYATPVGFFNIADYAHHKAYAANLEFKKPHALSVGIQYGIVLKSGGRWFAVDAVVVMDGGESLLESWWSELVPVPERIVEIVKRRGVTTTTVGMVVADLYQCSPDDPYPYLGGGSRSREELLSEALKTVFARLIDRKFIDAGTPMLGA